MLQNNEYIIIDVTVATITLQNEIVIIGCNFKNLIWQIHEKEENYHVSKI